jgi:hypothetical protein
MVPTGGAALACILLIGIPARRCRWQIAFGTLALFAASPAMSSLTVGHPW